MGPGQTKSGSVAMVTGLNNNGYLKAVDSKATISHCDSGASITITTAHSSSPSASSAGITDRGATRQEWTTPTEFLLSCISLSVGLGNFYRFPFVAYENGGGAFLIPYLLVLFFIGKPVYFMELALGQFCSYGQVKCWNLSPIFKGVGYGSLLSLLAVQTYYCSIMGLTVWYFIASFRTRLPWSVCNPEWRGAEYCEDASGNNTKSNSSFAQLYFERDVLNEKADIEDGIGVPDWRLTLCLLFSWATVFLSLVKGVKSSGKVAYFTSIFPYIVLLTLLLHGVIKDWPGSWDGIKYFFTPQWSKIGRPQVWFAAVGQCFFSLASGFGPIIMNASYNPFRQNVYKDAMIVTFMDTFTSLFAGMTVFAMLGSLAADLQVDISEVAQSSGPGLIFVTYADAIAKFEWLPQLFAVLFFLMLFALGVGSTVAWQMAAITVICDHFPQFSQFWATTLTCAACFLIGLIYVTPGGQWMLQLVDFFAGNFTIYVLATLEVVGIMWVYGMRNFTQDLEFMLEMRITWFWKFMWVAAVPLVLPAVLVYSLVQYEPIRYNGREFPDVAVGCGWLLAALCLICIPIGAAHSVWKRKEPTLRGKFVEASKPTGDWGPKDPLLKEEWLVHKSKIKEDGIFI